MQLDGANGVISGNRHMCSKFAGTIVAAILLCMSYGVYSKPLDPSVVHTDAIGKYASILRENDVSLSLPEAIALYRGGSVDSSEKSYLNFGIGSKPVWLIFEVENASTTTIKKRISLETSWIDWVDIYFLRGDEVSDSYQSGDRLPYNQRPIKSRFFSFDHEYRKGKTLIVLRVETTDPMVLPIYFTNIEASNERALQQSYGYGFLYGLIFALLVYNLMLYVSLRNSSYLFYSLHMLAFIAVNIAYTGHGYQWLWSGSPVWQMWSIPVLMTSYAIFGFLFAASFLNTKTDLPRFHRVITVGCCTIAIALLFFILAGSLLAVLFLAFSVVCFFAFGMTYSGILASQNGSRSAYYFLAAAILGSGGATITCATVWGIWPYSDLGYRSVELGTMFAAIILALALASRFNIINKEKDVAESLARLDPLTGLFNRRAFSEYAMPIWNASLRNGRDMAIIIMDIDRFKLINDSYGHAAGDDVLTTISRLLSEEARGGDIIARWGGEEFIMFLPETSVQKAEMVAERYRQRIGASRVAFADSFITFSASFGVAIKEKNEKSFEALISEADKRLYEAKQLGRNKVVSGRRD